MTTPSVIRHLRGWSGRPPSPDTVASLQRIVMMGEPADQDLVDWLEHEVGDGRLTVADGWGQTELSGLATVLDHPVDAVRLPDPGFAIVDGAGRPVAPGEPGELVLRNPWAGLMRGLEGVGAEDVVRRRWRLPGLYCTEDIVRRRPDGSLEFLGRSDEVINVSGQLVSLGEVREVLLEHPFVAAAEVVQRVDRRLGRSLAAAVVPVAGVRVDAGLARDLLDNVRELLGGLARPRALLFVDRFGDELSSAARRRALEALAAPVDDAPVQVTWEQVLAAAQLDA
jgi:acetyl-CoA synthetase